MESLTNWHHGSATHDRDDKGWLIGYFATEERAENYSPDVEIKWSDHAPGETQEEWQDSPGTSVSILVIGRMVIYFIDGHAVLSKPGDYVMWSPRISHRWRAENSTTIITIRWPSVPPAGPL